LLQLLISGGKNGTRLTIQENRCRLENTKHFQVISTKTSRPIFSAQHPVVSIDEKIKKLSTAKIVTNKRDGSIHLRGRLLFDTTRGLPLSPSPALAASIDAFRVCVCGGAEQKLFLTPGNKPCESSNALCT
uniref:Beta-sarcoglycan n=1 Tax=Haemonchus placei TaxID=6290 RepID=A0A0N4WJ51_HAEPC